MRLGRTGHKSVVISSNEEQRIRSEDKTTLRSTKKYILKGLKVALENKSHIQFKRINHETTKIKTLGPRLRDHDNYFASISS